LCVFLCVCVCVYYQFLVNKRFIYTGILPRTARSRLLNSTWFLHFIRVF